MTQADAFKDAANFEVGGERQMAGGRNFRYRRKDGKSAQDVRFPPLGYSRYAKKSYEIFKKLKAEGKLPADNRFQVSLPTPLAVVYAFLVDSEVRALWPIYEDKLLQEVDEIAAAIPHHELAVQWDVCPELHAFLEIPELIQAYPFDELVEFLARLCNRVPTDVEVGMHFCYGDSGHKKNRDPRDMSNMVKLFNAVSVSAKRPLNWIHLPVPKDRSDDAFFTPLTSLRLPEETQLYIGLIHISDGLEGAARRVATAQRYVKGFGVATECGFGRRPPETMPELLKLHKAVSEQL